MADYEVECSLEQGHKFQQDVHEPVGFVTKIKIGDKDLTADISCKNPMDGKELKAAIVMSSLSWPDIGNTEPLRLSGQVSAKNMQIVRTLLFTSLPKMKIAFQATVFEYDEAADKYYKSFTCGSDLNGQVERSDVPDPKGKTKEKLNLFVANTVSGYPTSPKCYSMFVGIIPIAKKQDVTLAAADQSNLSKEWGQDNS